MTNPRSGGRPGLLGHPPDEVEVTVTVLPRRGTSVRRRVANVRARRRNNIVIAVVIVAVAIAAAGVAGSVGDLGTAARSNRGQQPQLDAVRASTARCLDAVTALDRPRTQGDFDRAVWCERYAGRTRASSYRFVGAALPALHIARR